MIHTGFATRCNNDHGISPDGTSSPSAISRRREQIPGLHRADCAAARRGRSRRSRLRIGMAGRRMAKPSHSAASAEASSTSTLSPSTGGEETRLTTATGLDDGPEYSPDGTCIYFNSERTGTCRSGACAADGSDRSRSSPTRPTTGSRTSRPTASGWSFSLTRERHRPSREQGRDAAPDVDERTRKSSCWPSSSAARAPSTFLHGRPTATMAFVSYQLIPDEKAGKK